MTSIHLDTLATFGLQLGIPSDELAAIEGPAHLHHVFHGRHVALSPDTTREFIARFGGAARVEIRTGDLVELAIESSTSAADIDAFVNKSPTVYSVSIDIDKSKLAEVWGSQDSDHRHQAIFFFAEALRRILSRGLTAIEQELWVDPSLPLAVAVLDGNVSLHGPYLTVLGGEYLSEAQSLEATAAPLARRFASCRKHIDWGHSWTQHLTPWHFELHGTSPDSALRQLLSAQLVRMFLLFTCDRARPLAGQPGMIAVEYRGRDSVASFVVSDNQPVSLTTEEEAAALRVASWIYSDLSEASLDWAGDRLPLVQLRVAQFLQGIDEPSRLTSLFGNLPHLFEGIEWHWKAFMEGRVSHYLDQVRDLESLVAETTTGLETRTSELTRGLSDSILAAVAVLIGSFIAAALRDPFQEGLFRASMIAYAVYVLVFPAAIGLYSNWGAMDRTHRDFTARRQRFEAHLPPDKVTEIIGTRVTGLRAHYDRWLKGVAAIYVLVVIATVLAACLVPTLASPAPTVRSSPGASPTPSP